MGTRNGTGRRAAGLLLGALLLSGAQQGAHAQEGTVAGNLRLQPSFRVDAGYDSNVFFQSDEEDTVSAFRFDFQPRLRILTINPQVVDFTFDGNLNWRQFLKYDTEDPRDQTGLQAGLNAEARFNPLGFVSFALSDRFTRSLEPWLDPAGDPFQILRNNARAEVAFHRGGYNRDGRNGLTGHIGVRHQLAFYERFEQLDRQRIGADAELRWHMLPKTALVVDAHVDSLTFTNDQDPTVQTFANVGGLPYGGGIGFNGLITPRFAVYSRVGYHDMNRDEGPSRASVVGRFGMDIFFGRSQKLTLLYNNDFSDATQGNFVRFNRGLLAYEVKSGLVDFGLSGYYMRGRYGRVADTSFEGVSLLTTRNRVDDVVGGRVDLGFNVSRFAVVGALYQIDFRDSNFFVRSPTGTNQLDPTYTRHVAQVTLTLRY